MDRCKRRCPSEINFGSSSSSGLYQRSGWWTVIKCKLFVNDTSLFSVIHDVDTSANELYNDLCQINKWAFQWKMSYNLDSSKLLLAEKLKKFLIVRYVLIVALSRNHQIKNTSHISWCSINLWITFKSNNYQGKQNYRTDTGIAKCFATTGIKDYIQSFCETTSRLW